MHEDFYLKSIDLFNSQNNRPKYFLDDPKHCLECIDHEETLQKYTYKNIPIEKLDKPGWDPINYISLIGFSYYLPAFIRLILEQYTDCILGQLIFHLTYKDSKNKFLNSFSLEQKEFIIFFLKYLLENSSKYNINEVDKEDIIKTIDLWEEKKQS